MLALVPPGLLLLAGVLTLLLQAFRLPGGSPLAAAGCLAAGGAALGVWLAGGRNPIELSAPVAIAGTTFGLRLDALSLAVLLCALAPVAMLLASRGGTAGQAGLIALAVTAAAVCSEADRLLLAVAALATCCSLLALASPSLRDDSTDSGFASLWLWLAAALLLLLAGAVSVELAGGTSIYSATPVLALTLPAFLLLAGGGAATAGLAPWRPWPVTAWETGAAHSRAVAIALLPPLGFLLVARSYNLGAGHWPGSWLNPTLQGLGVAVALAAAIRAQGSAETGGFLAEVTAFNLGTALLALALGSQAGVAAALAVLAGSALLTGIGPLLTAVPRRLAVVGFLLAAGAPPAILFGARVLVLQAAVDSGGLSGFFALGEVAAWVVLVAAAVRALRLPASAGEPGGSVPAWTAGLALAAALALGLALGLFETGLALSAAAELIPGPTPGPPAASQVAGLGWEPLLLGLPLAGLLVLALLVRHPAEEAQSLAPEPAFRLPPWPARRPTFRLPAMPEDYRSLFDFPAHARALGRRPWLGVALTLGIAIIVARL
ncbi:MAG: hypothetical protein M3Y62_04235 [Candidatus Dormibacteraeota bacterium]|nr:hypothetical protein [Candidatus Dormibacteraeota bacterium]